ncbi:hypothetical protein OIU78_000102 [Salix suchowensis]|nr:hypothetical protein OIU78_000102 [Salix suchowensis]
MADSGHTSNYTDQDTKDAKSSANQDSNLQDFSEDEVSLIARMFRLVGNWNAKNRSSKQR